MWYLGEFSVKLLEDFPLKLLEVFLEENFPMEILSVEAPEEFPLYVFRIFYSAIPREFPGETPCRNSWWKS